MERGHVSKGSSIKFIWSLVTISMLCRWSLTSRPCGHPPLWSNPSLVCTINRTYYTFIGGLSRLPGRVRGHIWREDRWCTTLTKLYPEPTLLFKAIAQAVHCDNRVFEFLQEEHRTWSSTHSLTWQASIVQSQVLLRIVTGCRNQDEWAQIEKPKNR